MRFNISWRLQKEFRLKSSNGRYRWYEAFARPLFDGDRVPRGLVGVIQDITERRDSEVRLRRSEELLRATTANTADTLMLVDTGLKVRFNQQERRRHEHRANHRARDRRSIARAGARRRAGEAQGISSTRGRRRPTNSSPPTPMRCGISKIARCWLRDDGIGNGISISTRDITERKHLEQEILDVSGRERQSIGRDSTRRPGTGTDRRGVDAAGPREPG